MPSDNSRSISQYIADLKQGESVAEYWLWERLIAESLDMARKRMTNLGAKRRVADEEDVAGQALNSLMLGLRNGEYPQIQNRDGLFGLLREIIKCKAFNTVRDERAKKRGSGKVRGESVFVQIADESVAAGIQNQPGQPSGLIEASEIVRILEHQFASLDDELMQLILLKFSGHSNLEIAALLGVSLATTERRLNDVRVAWEQQLFKELLDWLRTGSATYDDLSPHRDECGDLFATSDIAERIFLRLPRMQEEAEVLLHSPSALPAQDRLPCSVSMAELRLGRTNGFPPSLSTHHRHFRKGLRLWGYIPTESSSGEPQLVHSFYYTGKRWVFLPHLEQFMDLILNV